MDNINWAYLSTNKNAIKLLDNWNKILPTLSIERQDKINNHKNGLDPLKAMDLAQNDPEALQKEIINVSKEFTKLKADGTGFEILPGAKRRLREVAQAMENKANPGEHGEEKLDKLKEMLIKKTREYSKSFPKHNRESRKGQELCTKICYHTREY